MTVKSLNPYDYMLIKRLWHGLFNALPRHPFLWYNLRNMALESKIFEEIALWRMLLIYLASGVMLFFGLFFWMAMGAPLGALIFVSSMFAGATVAQGIGINILRERERGRYDLMALTMSGLLGSTWALSTRYIRNNDTFNRISQTANLIHTMLTLCLIPAFFLTVVAIANYGSAFGIRPFEYPITDFSLYTNATIFIIVARLDYMYSIVTGAIVGMVTPSFLHRRSEGLVTLVISFSLVQVLLYIVILLLTGLATVLVVNYVGEAHWLLSSLAWFTMYCVCREVWLYGLCAVAARRMNSTLHEVITIYRSSI